ncbi:MAG: hypothetical protein IKP86_06465 [Anaerolineaceae bacterium]|nr:hypothetical protein [Anaerolineaceae bacterium]
MEHFELVEKFVNTFGVSYEKAKEVLETSSWDPIEAAVLLEKEKNAAPEKENVTAEEPKQENAGTSEQAQEEANTCGSKGPKGSTVNIPVEDIKNAGYNAFKYIWDFLSKNSFVVKKSSGEVFLDIPIWLMVLLVCAFFWPVVLTLGLVFIMGYRFSFSGPQLGKKNVKKTVEHVENMTEEFVSKVKYAVAPDACEPVNEQPEIVVETNTESDKEADVDNNNGNNDPENTSGSSAEE